MASADGDRIEDLARAVTAQGRVLAMLVNGQKLHNEMAAKVLEMSAKILDAVTKEGDSELGDILRKLSAESTHHTERLDAIFERVYSE
jgi:hypothetical protein